MTEEKPKLTNDDYILVGNGSNAATIRVGDISSIEVDKNYLSVKRNGLKAIEIYGSLAKCQRRLPCSFFRVGRHCIVNLAAVQSVDMTFKQFGLTMKDGTTIEVSRSRSSKLRREFAL